ncbi:MAG: tetratricopeptide repeat protein [Bryobacteraceae bacterium]
MSLFDSAVLHHQAGRLEQARQIYQRLLVGTPRNADLLHLLGVIHSEQRQHHDAIDHIRRAIAIAPAAVYQRNLALALTRLGRDLRETGRIEEALPLLEEAARLNPAADGARANLALCLHERGNRHFEENRPDRAAADYERAIALQPEFAEAFYNLGVLRMSENRVAEARDCYLAAIARNAAYAEAHNNLGNVQLALGELEPALAAYHRALEIRPDYLEARYNLGIALQNADRFEEARAVYGDVLARDPWHADAHNNLGGIALAENRVRDAIAHYQRALDVHAGHADASWNLGLAHLTLGEFEPGWRYYETRKLPARECTAPRWGGENLAGKTLLVWAEQGLGDTIQFMRYLPLVPGRVIFECQPRLAPLVPQSAAPAGYDYHTPLLSLPFLFGTTLDTIPPVAPLPVPGDRVTRWLGALAGRSGLRVGLCWAANVANFKGRKRSIPPAALARLAAIPGLALYSLQRDATAENMAALPGLMRLETESSDILDTAAIVASLDLVISVDTMIAHLAGTLARPVWTLLPFAADWRWMLDRSDTPWYPTMRLFRQRRLGDWESVVEEVGRELDGLVASL